MAQAQHLLVLITFAKSYREVGAALPIGKDNCSCNGGFSRIAAVVKSFRQQHPQNTLVLDAGDQFSGTTWFTYYQGSVQAEALNLMQYDAMTVGNHEFDRGGQVLADFIGLLSAPVLSANIDASAYAPLAGKIKPYKIFTFQNVKVGVFGLTTLQAMFSQPPPQVVFNDPYTTASSIVLQLKGAGCNIIIASSHLGFEGDQQLASTVSDIDLILSAHSHYLQSNDADILRNFTSTDAFAGPYPTCLNNTAWQKCDVTPNSTPIVSTYFNGLVVGTMDLTFDDSGKLVNFTGAPILINNATTEDSEMKALIQSRVGPINAFTQTVVGVNEALLTNLCAAAECTAGNLVADSMLQSSLIEKYVPYLVVLPSFSVRAGLDVGNITVDELLSMLPFGFRISSFKTTGTVINLLLAGSLTPANYAASGFFQVANAKVTFEGVMNKDVNVSPPTLKSLEVKGLDGQYHLLNTSQTYQVITTEPVAKTAVKLVPSGALQDLLVTGPVDVDQLIQYINVTLSGHVSKKYAQTEGRLVYAGASSQSSSAARFVLRSISPFALLGLLFTLM